MNEHRVTGEINYKKKFELTEDDLKPCNCDKDCDCEIKSNVLYSQSTIIHGHGLAIVCTVGEKTQHYLNECCKFDKHVSLKFEQTYFSKVLYYQLKKQEKSGLWLLIFFCVISLLKYSSIYLRDKEGHIKHNMVS